MWNIYRNRPCVRPQRSLNKFPRWNSMQTELLSSVCLSKALCLRNALNGPGSGYPILQLAPAQGSTTQPCKEGEWGPGICCPHPPGWLHPQLRPLLLPGATPSSSSQPSQPGVSLPPTHPFENGHPYQTLLKLPSLNMPSAFCWDPD